MPGYILIDTEGSGLFDFKRPAEAEGQPRLAELAMIYLDDNLIAEREYQAYIQPDGWEMHPDATAVNGLTTEFLQRHGVPVQMALNVYTTAILTGRAVVAHNAQHDCKQLRAELKRAGLPDMFEQTKNVCTMRGAMSFKVKKLNGKGGFPGLLDLAAHFNVAPPDKAHGGVGDVRCLERVFRAMVAAGFEPQPMIHRAKDHAAILAAV